jgi:hypothetical protein
MKTLTFISFFIILAATSFGIELQKIPHRVVADEITHVRDVSDRRYSVWADNPEKASEILSEFNLKPQKFELKEKEILVVFLNDRIEEDLIQIVHNKTAGEYFSDYANSGKKFRLRRLSEDKKFTHLTAVIFSPPTIPNHLGIRSMVRDGLSEKR